MSVLGTILDLPVPRPPVSMGQSDVKEAIFTGICALPLLASLILAIRMWARDREPLLMLCLLGGATSTIVEPLLDSNGGVWWPAESWEVFNFANVNLPWLVPFVYPWLLGGQGYLFYRAFCDRVGPARIWKLLALAAAVDMALEIPGLQLGVYAYYGNQPLKLLGLPLWYVPMNACGPMIAGAAFYLLRDHFPGGRVFALLPLFPMSFALMYFGCGFPMWLSLQSDWPIGTATAATMASYGMTYLMVKFMLVATGTIARPTVEQDVGLRQPLRAGT